MSAIFRQIKAGQYSSPKTVLGFYAGVLAILEIGVVAVLLVLATDDSLFFLIPWVLGFGALLMIILLGVVVAMNIRSPHKLQLGEVSGKDFLQHEQVMRGDSIAGEYLGSAPAPTRATNVTGPPELEERAEAEVVREDREEASG